MGKLKSIFRRNLFPDQAGQLSSNLLDSPSIPDPISSKQLTNVHTQVLVTRNLMLNRLQLQHTVAEGPGDTAAKDSRDKLFATDVLEQLTTTSIIRTPELPVLDDVIITTARSWAAMTTRGNQRPPSACTRDGKRNDLLTLISKLHQVSWKGGGRCSEWKKAEFHELVTASKIKINGMKSTAKCYHNTSVIDQL
ncbi:hypothetical protein LX32DRAFT_699361 [Colletotrichum zoysiae]|uniref:Uncharacterized protein n=1 Tax=Colletotrichum zoysiae TaxID=1216348 RepID=A0AAD9H4V5_9PEZI|nr:hypothetical protein LX32DRAFT_699361 [Colletotrichum zoysiae]